MIKTLQARFDGEALHPEESLSLAPNTQVLITVDIPEAEVVAGTDLGAVSAPEKGAPYSFLEYAASLQLEGPEDWSERWEDYLEGEGRSHDE
jgi:hypothetical protein